MSDTELVKCPLCDSTELRQQESATVCLGCKSVLSQAGIEALAGVELPDEPESPLDELSELSR